MAEQKFLGHEFMMSNFSDINRMFSYLKKLIVQAFGTPRWISELSIMADEVRDRTILVKINSQTHSWSDLGISCLFSEIGMVEEVRYLPTESGFHSLVRFQTRYSSQYAYHYYNGRCLHQDCCKVEIHHPDAIIRWNAQKVDEIKATYGISDVPVEACDANLHEGRMKCDDLIHQDEEPSQILAQNEPNSAKESSILVAHQVLEEMPRSFVSDEMMFLDEIEKINDELLEGMDSEAPPIGLADELDGMKVIEDGELRNTTPTTHALKFPIEFSEKESMMNGVVCVICFDPGGSLLPIDTSIITSSFDQGGSQQGYVPPPLSNPPAGFVVDDQERVLMTSSKRIVTVVDPTNNLPMECTIRRIFTSSKGAECMLLYLVDMPVEIVRSTSDGWAAITDEELDAILPTTDIEHSIMEFVAEGETIERMPCEPTNVMCGVLLAGCRAHKDYKLSEFVAWKLVEMEPENSARYVVLSNLYAEMGRWADVSKVRGLMEERELMKAFEINDLKYAPLLLVINEFSDFIKFPSELPAQNVRMVAYIGVLCFDPRGEKMLSAFDDFDRCCTGIKLSNGAAELLAYDYDFVRIEVIGLNYKMSFGLTHLIQGLIFVRMVTVAAVHAHHEGKVLILVFDPGGEHVQLMSLVAMLVFQSYILEDKDLLNKGELLQEYQY